jgi:putative endopeptidase
MPCDCRLFVGFLFLLAATALTTAMSAAGLRQGAAEWSGSNAITAQQTASAEHYRDTMLSYGSPGVSPCKDFYEHVCGAYVAQQRNRSATQEESVFDDLEAVVDARIQAIASDHWPIIDTWYSTCMNATRRQQSGLAALQPLFFAVDQVLDTPSLLTMLGRLHRYGVSAFFTPVVALNESNSAQNVLYLDWPQLLVPYEIAEARNSSDRALYEQWALALAQAVLGSARLAGAVVAIEQQIADAMTAAQDGYAETALPFPGTGYAAQLLAALPPTAAAPAAVLSAGATFPTDVVAAVLAANDLGSVRAYLKVRVAAALLDALPGGADDCVGSLRTWLGPVLDHYYAAIYASPAARDGAAGMLQYVLGAFGALLNQTAWMDAPTKAAAERKLAAIEPLIGYPDHWASVIPPEAIVAGDHLGNAFRVLQATKLAELRRLAAPAARYAWEMPTYAVNAYYSPTANDIVFPSGIIQGPFYNESLPAAANYGGLASVMGHELGHAFDNSGRHYDWDGNLNDWWTPQSAAAFEQQAECVVQLYQGLEVDTGIYVDGAQTLGENWADLEGLPAAYLAFKLHRAALEPVAARAQAYLVQRVFGFGEDELFFRAWALHWCAYEPRADEYERAETDVHAPPRWRVNVPAMQNADFLRVFGCPADAGTFGEQAHCAVF